MKEVIVFDKNYSFDYKDYHYNRIRLYSFFRKNLEKYEINYYEQKIYKIEKWGKYCGMDDFKEIDYRTDKFLKYFFKIIKEIEKDNLIEANFFNSIKEWKEIKRWLFYYD